MTTLVPLMIVGLAALALAACGGDEPGTDPTATATAPAEATSTPDGESTPGTADPTATSEITEPGQQSGTLVHGSSEVGAASFVPFLGAVSDTYGFREPLVWRDTAPIPRLGDVRPDQSIAEAWEVDPDGSKITFTIREGVPFHKGWGDVTAEDVAWSHNNGLAEANLNNRSGFIGEYIDRWEAIDERTAVMHVEQPLSVRWDVEMSNQWRQTIAISSKKAYDELGEEAANLEFAGTGPFEVTRWTTNEIIEADALPEHYRETARVAHFRVVAIPEISSMVAALQTGEVHIAEVPATSVAELEEEGITRRSLGAGTVMYTSFGGNYWAMEYQATGETVFPRPGFNPDLPWIGDPRDEESMERARKVREAMTIAINRDELSEFVEAGLSSPAHTAVGFTPEDPQWKDEWLKPFDPDRARQLLAEAGYEDGFPVPFWAGRNINGYPQLATVMAAQWSDIGLRPSVEVTAYEVYRPNLINREMPMLYIHNDKQGDHDDPRGRLWSPEPGGANRAIEISDEILEEHYYTSVVEPDASKRIEHNVALEDYMSHWHLFVPMVNRTRHYMVRPEVTQWEPFTENFGNFNAPWTVVLQE
ncbi:MAG: ABC transporter substrate-binding protein [Dehalococcoidia bacterium]